MGCGVTELMADFTQLITNLQADVDAADSDTSMRDILALLYRGSKITTFHKWYDSASVLPIDSAYGGYIAFTKSDNALRVFNDSDMRWAALDSALPPPPPDAAPYQGSNFGYAMGGYPTRNTIEKYSYSSDGNTTDVGDMTQSKLYLAGSSSSAHGYAAGGQTGPTSSQNVIEKFTFPSDANASDVGDLTVPRSRLGGATGQTHGYGVAGNGPLSPNTPASFINTVDKYAYATDGNATDVGDITEIKYGLAMGTMASTENAYSAGGRLFSPSSVYSNVIDKWPLSTDTNAADVGDLTVGRGDIASASSSDTHGYASGGVDPTSPNPVSPFWQPTIDKWAFASDGNATSVGNITGPGTAGVRYRAGTQSTTHGYSHGGNPNVNVIEKFPFATDTDATDVGDLSSSGNGMTGAQY